MIQLLSKVLLSIALSGLPVLSHAYLGPGLAGGFVVAIFGFLFAIILALWGILYYPIKRRWHDKKEQGNKAEQEGESVKENDSET